MDYIEIPKQSKFLVPDQFSVKYGKGTVFWKEIHERHYRYLYSYIFRSIKGTAYIENVFNDVKNILRMGIK